LRDGARNIVVDGVTPSAQLSIPQPRIEVAPLDHNAYGVESHVVDAIQRPQQISEITRFDPDGTLRMGGVQVGKQVGLKGKRWKTKAKKNEAG